MPTLCSAFLPHHSGCWRPCFWRLHSSSFALWPDYWSEIGLIRLSDWNATEKSYFVQVVLIAGAVFPMLFAPQLRVIFAASSAGSILWTVFVPYLFFGFYQEVLYRGMLQTELV